MLCWVYAIYAYNSETEDRKGNIECLVHKNTVVYIDHWVFWPFNLKIRGPLNSVIEDCKENLVKYGMFIS